jgi:hypothetical protein
MTLVRGLAYPADLYLEGSDQHRGWFQSSLLTGRSLLPSTSLLNRCTFGGIRWVHDFSPVYQTGEHGEMRPTRLRLS